MNLKKGGFIMIRVYVESSVGAEQVAIFEDDSLYNDCLPIIERYAKDKNWDIVSESVEDWLELDDLEVKDSVKLLQKVDVIESNPKLFSKFRSKFTTDFEWLRAGIKSDMVKQSAIDFINELV